MCPLLFSTSPLPQRLEGFTDTIVISLKKQVTAELSGVSVSQKLPMKFSNFTFLQEVYAPVHWHGQECGVPAVVSWCHSNIAS